MNKIRAAGWVFAIALLPGYPAQSAEDQFLSVAREGNNYLISASFVIDGCITAVREVFTDFTRLARLNPSVSASAILLKEADRTIVSTTLRECVLFFCEDLVMVAAVRRTPVGGLEATVLPGYGDFSSGRAQWRFVGIGAKTQVFYDGRLHLDRRLPPLFGSRLVRRSIARNLRATVRNAERLATGTAADSIPEQQQGCGPNNSTHSLAKTSGGRTRAH